MNISSTAAQLKETREKIMPRVVKKKETIEEQQERKEKGKNNIPCSKEHKILRIPVTRSHVKEKPSDDMEKCGVARGKKRKLWIPPGAA